MTDTRDLFERTFALCDRQTWQHKDGSYKDASVQKQWEGWQRALATVPSSLDQLRDKIKGMQEAAYTYGDYSKEAVSIALDGVLEAIDELEKAQLATPALTAPSERHCTISGCSGAPAAHSLFCPAHRDE